MNFKQSVSLAYFSSHDGPLKDQSVRWRNVANELGLSSQAKEKLEWMIFYQSVGNKNAALTAKYFGISRKTLHKWIARFDERNLKSLEEVSRAPHKKREWMVTMKEEEQIKTLREQTKCRYGKKKLKVLYNETYNEDISTWKIESVVRKYQLYKNPEEVSKKAKNKAKRKKKQRLLITEFKKTYDPEKQILWHVDAIILWWYNQRRVIFTALEEHTKIGYARVYKTNSSENSKDFLERLMYLVEGRVSFIHSDNGSEFEGAFAEACALFQITHIYSRARTPKDNAALERFNRTVQDEWLSLSEVGLDDINDANKDMSEWLGEYNTYRPHQSLDYQTPLAYATSYFNKVLPMYPASTSN